MSKPSRSSSRPVSASSSMGTSISNTAKRSNAGNPRFFRPVPYSTTLAMQQLMDGGSDASYIRRPTPVKRASGTSSSRSRYPEPTRGSTARDATQSEIGRGHNLPVVDEQGQVWLDWEEKQEYLGLMEEEKKEREQLFASGRRATIGGQEAGDDGVWVGFPSPGLGEGREDSDEESARRQFLDQPSRQLLEAFSFAERPGSSSSTSANAPSRPLRRRSSSVEAADNDLIPPDQMGTRPKGKARIRRVRTSESLRAGSAPLVIPPIPSQHHLIRSEDDLAAEEFLASSFNPPLFNPTAEEIERLKRGGKRSSLFRNLARKLTGKKQLNDP